jgi:hypothetical protein
LVKNKLTWYGRESFFNGEGFFIGSDHFITGGAVSAAWWTGPNKKFEEGFMLISVRNGDFSSKYIDYGWNAKN